MWIQVRNSDQVVTRLSDTQRSPRDGSFTTSTATIIGYASSDRKSYHILLDYLPDPVGITVRSWVFSYQYTDTTPITSISVSADQGDFVVGSSYAVYGLN